MSHPTVIDDRTAPFDPAPFGRTTSLDPATIDRSACGHRSTRPLPRQVLGMTAQVCGEALLVVALLLAYRRVRLLTLDDYAVAQRHAREIIGLERSLHIFNEATIQQFALRSPALVSVLNRYYVTVHIPLTAVFLTWVYLRHREQYTRIRNWFVAVTAMALVIHIAFPLAPPRLVPDLHVVDTLQRFGPRVYNTDAVAATANQIAAMPSLHVGWSVMVAIGVLRCGPPRRSRLILLHPAVTLVAVVATANHYWLDAVAAVALVAVGWQLARPRRARPQTRRTPTPNPAIASRPTVPARTVGPSVLSTASERAPRLRSHPMGPVRPSDPAAELVLATGSTPGWPTDTSSPSELPEVLR